MVNQVNRLGQTPLHLAVKWPCGVRLLLKKGASKESSDLWGRKPLYYAIELGCTETVCLLMEACCSLELVAEGSLDPIEFATEMYFRHQAEPSGLLPLEDREAILDTIISLEAGRRVDLQDRLAETYTTRKASAHLVQSDRILDDHARDAEQVLLNYGRYPLYVSTVGPRRRTVYHTPYLTVEVAEKLWQAGFRDVDVTDTYGRTPLMLSNYDVDLVTRIEVSTWLVQKGAKLHRHINGSLDHDPDTVERLVESSSTNIPLHHVAANIGAAVYIRDYILEAYATQHISFRSRFIDCDRVLAFFQTLYPSITLKLKDHLECISECSKEILATLFSDRAHDRCICACSSQGCSAATMMLKGFPSQTWSNLTTFAGRMRGNFPQGELMIEWSLLSTGFLIDLVGSHHASWSWLGREIIQFQTFQVLELRHTCCKLQTMEDFKELDADEVTEIREEDFEGIQLLERLLQEFEEKRGDQDIITFFQGYWAATMNEVLQSQGSVDKEKLREIGIVLHEDGIEDSDDPYLQVEYKDEDDIEDDDDDGWQSASSDFRPTEDSAGDDAQNSEPSTTEERHQSLGIQVADSMTPAV